MRKSLLLLFTGLYMATAYGQPVNYWTATDERSAGKDLFLAAHSKRPASFKLFRLDEAGFKIMLGPAPSEQTIQVANSPFIILFPMPDGTVKPFRIVKAPCMAPELAARYPGINSYAGRGVDDPSANIRFDVSMHGVHATVMYPENPPVYIDQLYENYYRVVKRTDMTDMPVNFRCLTDDTGTAGGGRNNFIENADDGKLRTYRLAMIASAEFALHFIPAGGLPTRADSVAAVIAAQNSHVTRSNQVYERDFGVRMQLVANNDLLVYFDPATDPVDDPNGPSQTPLHAAITSLIGSSNFDIGHTACKSTSSGDNNGNAGCIGCVCLNSTKGRGFTSYHDPSLLEFFVIDYLTHELGHQFGANHTFSFSLEGTGVNVEPGSGVTIMGYAGITGPMDVAPHSISIFSVKSIEQVTAYVRTGSGASCAQVTITGNTAPVVNAGPDHIIPFSTPFKLTGTASDPDATDVLTYNWEQTDNRISAPSIPAASSTTGPMFRTYLDYTIPERTFPSLQYILSGANGFMWEVLPSVARPLNFRFIAKDNHTGGGNNQTDDVTITVSGAAGPFLITSPNTAVSYAATTSQTVTWSVNGTTGAPVNCANVKISLSTDGGFTFPIVLTASTPNDGSENIIIPNMLTTTGRIKVEATGNIFFDINNANITITPPPSGFTFSSPAPVVAACPTPASLSTTLTASYFGGHTGNISLTATVSPAGSVTVSPATLTTSTTSTTVTLNSASTLPAGTYTVTVTGTSTGVPTQVRDIIFTITPVVPPITAQPANASVCEGADAIFSVTSPGATAYQWQVSTDGGTTWNNIAGAMSSSYTVAAPGISMHGNNYRVRVSNTCGSAFSSAAVLDVRPLPLITSSPASITICEGAGATFSVAVTASGGVLTYQWQLSTDGGTTWQNISGATAASFAQASVPVGQNGYRFRVIVSAGCGSVTSNPAIITVNAYPVISFSPTSVVCVSDGALTLSATPGAGVFSGSGVSGSTFTPSVAGIGPKVITYTATNAGCVSAVTRTILVNECAERHLTLNQYPALLVYPKPNNGNFNIRLNTDLYTKLNIQVYNSMGQLIKSQTATGLLYGSVIPVQLQNAPAGTYHLFISNDERGEVSRKGVSLVVY